MKIKKTKTNVKLLHATPLKIVDIAIGTCWDKQRDDNVIDTIRMDRVINKFHHASTAEHINYNFYIKNISRLLLQELARTRIASFSVKSSRYTLSELRKEESFITEFEFLPNDKVSVVVSDDEIERAFKYIRFIGNENIDKNSIVELEILRRNVVNNISNDVAKYNLPECYLTELTFTINVRSLQNFLSLRTNKTAHFEIRELAYELYKQLPEDHKFLFKDNLYFFNTELPNITKDKDFRSAVYGLDKENKIRNFILLFSYKDEILDKLIENYSIEELQEFVKTIGVILKEK